MTTSETRRYTEAIALLREIANEDYRGNRSSASQKAHAFIQSLANKSDQPSAGAALRAATAKSGILADAIGGI